MTYSQQTEQSLEPTDEALVARARRGDSAAFERLVARYEGRLFNYIRRIVGNAPDAEDLFQETFLRVFRHMGRFRVSASFRPWVYRIATNLCRDLLRRRKRRRTVALDAAAPSGDGSTLLDRMVSSAPGPRELAGEHELAEQLQEALSKLSIKHRSVFVMARYDGMPYEEIAQALRIPVGTVKSRMNKAVDTLMRAIEEVRK